MLATVAQPALGNLGVPPLASHLFVLYYGVISEITPPVCASAYAAAGIAGSNPFKTGLSAFSLGIGKLLVPMVFVYSPAMLIVLDDYFTWAEFIQTATTCALGVFFVVLFSCRVLPCVYEWPKPCHVCSCGVTFGVSQYYCNTLCITVGFACTGTSNL